MRMLGKNLLLAPLPDQEQTSGGIILPMAQAGDVRNYWRVESVGPKVSEIQVGDLIVTPLHMSHTSLEDGSNRKIVDADQIIAKLEAAAFVPELVSPVTNLDS